VVAVARFTRRPQDQESLRQRQQREEALLRRYATLEEDELLAQLGTSSQGLSAEAAEERLEEHGPNIITAGRQRGVGARLLEALINPFNIVLFLIAVVTFVTDVLLTEKPDVTTSLIIVALVLLSSAVSFVQSERSNTAAEKLTKMISNRADLLREGADFETTIDQIVPGDVVKLSAGDIIPGDVRFLSAKDAFVAQAALTGESTPVEKFSDRRGGEGDALTDLPNLGFMGANMVSGSALAVVLATGGQTFFGALAKSLSGDKAKNSFERGVESVSRLLIRFMLVMVPVIFVVNGLTKRDWGDALLFAVTMAVGLTPEMLPVIMTSTLARGAVSMSKRQTIVKTPSAIQTFGEMDVLCTDKTGTLTEDRIVLEKYMDVRGRDDMRVLRHAYLNSAFQTGLKNLIDVAILRRGGEENLASEREKYTGVDEIPFDFERRRMSVVLQNAEGKRQLITKGAVQEVLACCSFVEEDGVAKPITPENAAAAMAVFEQYNDEGLRVIAVAQKNDVADEKRFSVADESAMVLLGFVGFLDPPKESSVQAIAALQAHGVRVVVLTGDSEGVAIKVCGRVGVDVSHSLTGADVEDMDEAQLQNAVRTCSLFSKLAPDQKERVVTAFQEAGHTVGYLGDGINDAPALRQADVGISVDSGVDIAKETADIILLKKDLMVLENGVLEGRRTFGNIVKYIKMAASGNFGNMFSVMAASIFLPFLPLLPVHILLQNLLCDFGQLGIPFDNVDPEYLRAPRRWETRSISRFMVMMGPLSSLFDVLCFAVLWWALGANTTAKEQVRLFQCGWFLFGTISQTLVIHMIRTRRVPFLESRPAWPLLISSLVICVLTVYIAYGPLAPAVDMTQLPAIFAPWLLLLLAGYCAATQAFKAWYVRRFGEWL
jgi:Mg2+-importing ATPase